MESTSTGDKRFALLIDADNVSAKYLQPILDELSNYGTVTYKRIYGDWTLASHVKWKKVLLENSITPIQQFGYTQGKNATDSAMIIDAMDILYAGGVEGFCIVSSDSDFTRLAVRLRESGRTVIGMGEKKTPIPFRKACDIFTTLELLVQDRRKVSENVTSKEEIERAVVDIIVTNQNNGKGTGLGEVGSRLQKRYPDFDVRNYGTNVLSNLLESFASVRIVKSRNNVAVLLAEDAETLAELDEMREAKRDSKRSVKQGTKVAEEAAADLAETTEEAEGMNSEDDENGKGHKRRKKRRASRKVLDDKTPHADSSSEEGEDAAAAEDAEGTAAVETEGDDHTAEPAADSPVANAEAYSDASESLASGSADMEEGEVVTAAEMAGEAAEGPSPAEVDDKKPASKPKTRKRKRGERAKKAKSEGKNASAENAIDDGESGIAEGVREEFLAAASTKMISGSVVETVIETVEAAAVTATEAVSETADAVRDTIGKAAGRSTRKAASKAAQVASSSAADAQEKALNFMRTKLTAVGDEGIPVTNLSKMVRNRFKDFKVRELGFQHLRGYLDSVDFVEVQKRGNDFIALLKK